MSVILHTQNTAGSQSLRLFEINGFCKYEKTFAHLVRINGMQIL